MLLQNAAKGSREQLATLGAELEKLGKKLQDIAAKAANGATKPEAPAKGDGASAPTSPN